MTLHQGDSYIWVLLDPTSVPPGTNLPGTSLGLSTNW